MTAVVKGTTEAGALTFICPGCNQRHKVMTGTGAGPRWGWNGSFDKPTFTPSILVTWNEPSDIPEEFDDPSKDIRKACHSFITEGRIQFLDDCSHSLAGKTVPLPSIED